MITLRPAPDGYVDADGNAWAVNRVIVGDGINDFCEACDADVQDRAFSMFLLGMGGVYCSDCVEFVDGAEPPAVEDRWTEEVGR